MLPDYKTSKDGDAEEEVWAHAVKDAEGVNFSKDVRLTKFVSFLLLPVRVERMDKWQREREREREREHCKWTYASEDWHE